MHPKLPFITRRGPKVLAATSIILALATGVSACARNSDPTTVAVGNTTAELSGETTTPTTIDSKATPSSATPPDSAPAPTSDQTAPEQPTEPTNPGVVTQTTLPRPDEFQVLVTMLETGGRCAGPCGNVQTTLFSDGTWSYGLVPNPEAVTATTLPHIQGQIETALLEQLKVALAKATSTELQGLPVTQQYCPSAADGRDLSYTYRLQGTEVIVSNCTVDLLEANELLRLTSLAREDIAIMANQKG